MWNCTFVPVLGYGHGELLLGMVALSTYILTLFIITWGLAFYKRVYTSLLWDSQKSVDFMILKYTYIYTIIHHKYQVISNKPSATGWLVDTDDGAASTVDIVWLAVAKVT